MSSTSVLSKTPRVADEIAKFSNPVKELAYGTSGFRDDASILPSTFLRMGMLAVLRSKQQGKIIGLMVTASHNVSTDNGIKIVDPNGDMLSQSWEKYATQLANAEQNKAVEVLDRIVKAENIDLEDSGHVFIAKDTRPSSDQLAEYAREGALVIGGSVLDFGLQTTPQLHHLVRMWNFDQYNKGDWASEVGYYHMLTDAFKQLTASVEAKNLDMRTPLYVDCANGVGATQLQKLAKELGESQSLHLEICNKPSDGELNRNCGAEFVQKSKKPPTGMSPDADRGRRYCSLDGDADRIVYHYVDNDGNWHLLDGDKIACLFALFFKEKLSVLRTSANLGCVQTAYANGSATLFLKKQGIPVVTAKTGVKYVHAKAKEYEIGIYFEANGHGSVLFRDEFVDQLHQWEQNQSLDDSKKNAIAQLLAAHQLLNQATGDAISVLLMVEVLLSQRHWTIQNWDMMYTDLPSRQTKVKINNKSVVVMDEMDDTILLQPNSLRSAIQDIVASDEVKSANGRAFIRPSGTEDAIRVYAEATTQKMADDLALRVAKAIHKFAGGAGSEPDGF